MKDLKIFLFLCLPNIETYMATLGSALDYSKTKNRTRWGARGRRGDPVLTGGEGHSNCMERKAPRPPPTNPIESYVVDQIWF